MSTIAELQREAQQSTDERRLHELAGHRSWHVRWAVARSRAASSDTVRQLLDDDNSNVRMHAASQLADRPDLHEAAASSPHNWVRASLAMAFSRRDSGQLAYEVQRTLVDDSSFETRKGLAQTTGYADLFDRLLDDENPKVRGWCAANPRITLTQMEQLVTDRSSVVRRLSATLGLRYPNDEQILRLAQDRSKEVRWAVLFRAEIPREAIEIVARDTDELNRQHAERELASGGFLLSPQARDSIAAERRRAESASPFEQPPR
jgi:hypothetical protein